MGVVAVLTVKKIGSVTASAVAPPLPLNVIVMSCWLVPLPAGRKFLPLAIMSIELTVPAALTLAESSARIPSGPNGCDTVTAGGDD